MVLSNTQSISILNFLLKDILEMLQPVLEKLCSKRIVLASGSPRRKEILSKIGFPFEVIPSTFEENLDKSSFDHPSGYVLETGKLKTIEVANRLLTDENQPFLVIGADTVVTMDGNIFEKPKDKEHAFHMLSGFSGKMHTVFTGITLIQYKKDLPADQTMPEEQKFDITQFYESTDVNFTIMTSEMIRSYIETGEPMDKAGGYGIQAAGGTLIESISGDYFNVMGFPLHKFAKKMLKICDDLS